MAQGWDWAKRLGQLRIALVLAIYYGLILFLCLVWGVTQRYGITGDEPHYLIMARGLLQHGTFEQTPAYSDAFRDHAICRCGFDPPGTAPTPRNTHAVLGPHGLYNVHNIGLPLLIALPYLVGEPLGQGLFATLRMAGAHLPPQIGAGIGGVVAAKLFLILLSGLVPVFAWKIASSFSNDQKIVFWSTFATTVALPFILAATQIYPDLLAGAISLACLYRLLTRARQRSLAVEFLYLGAAALLPWLQIKFAATGAIILAALVLLHAGRKAGRRLAIVSTAVAVGTFSILIAYNTYAFGNPLGPYQNDALVPSPTAFMVFLGLHLDQNQGFLLQNPLLFLGVFAIGLLMVRDWKLGAVWLLVYASLIVPNALHPAWYGGFSFLGRFQWSAATVFLLPALLGLSEVGARRPKAFRALVLASVALQGVLYLRYSILNAAITNSYPDTWLDGYSSFYWPFQRWLPALYNIDWADRFAPNYVFPALAVALLVWGFFYGAGRARPSAQRLAQLAGIIGAAIIMAGLLADAPRKPIERLPISLLHTTGQLEAGGLTAKSGADRPDYLALAAPMGFGPGTYKALVHYASSASSDGSAGYVEVYNRTRSQSPFNGVMTGTNGQKGVATLTFTVGPWLVPQYLQVRSFWNGSADMTITRIEIARLD